MPEMEGSMAAGELQEAFSIFDTKGDGCIHAHQLGEVLRALGKNPTEADIKKFGYAQRPEERISFQVFLPILQEISKTKATYRAEDFVEGLRNFDKDQSGNINSAELRHLLTRLGERLTDEEFEQVVSNMEDSQGMINYESFVRNILSN